MMEVAVIGAGSAGLTTARHLISAGLRPTVFEAAKTVGGSWQSSNGKMWDGMHTNLSRYTCRFTDWPWDISLDHDGTTATTSTFPSVREMHSYLQSYSHHFLSGSDVDFQMECEVINVEPLPLLSDTTTAVSVPVQDISNDVTPCNKDGPFSCHNAGGYNVEWIDLNTNTKSKKEFDGVVIASGFFRTPKFPSFINNYKSKSREEITSAATTTTAAATTAAATTCNEKRIEVIHSSDYKTHKSYRNKNVAVIGSSFSALEIAADVSQSASRVVNIVPSVPWVLPRYVSKLQPLLHNDGSNTESCTNTKESESSSSSITVLPIDLAFYQRTNPFPQQENAQLTSDACIKKHKFLQSLVGHKQKNSPLGEPINREDPPFVVIGDEYLDLIRESRIEVIHGRLEGIENDGSLCVSDSRTVSNMDVVICCTGYTPNLQSILSQSVLEKLEYDSEDTFSPLSLAWDVLHPSLPGLGFCGMYRGPYMGIMDLQARLLAGTFSGKLTLDKKKVQSALEASKLIRTLRPRAQFPRFDYTGYIDTLAMLCYNGKYPTANTKTGDMIVPSFYQPDDDIIKQTSAELNEEIRKGQDGSRMPKLILQSILGNWTYDRNIVHFQTQKVERVSGTVKYTKYSHRAKSDEASNNNANDATDDKYVLYREDGLYELTPTQKFEVFREYEYITRDDALEIYFVEGGVRAHLFLSLKFLPETQLSQEDGHWVKATSDHLCIKDLYSANFRVKLDGVSASEIVIKYRVKGPSKDYESTTVLKPKFK